MIAGIWDCLSSQDVVNFVRYQVSEGKELTEIGEMICDHCLAPDTTAGDGGIGCDNMTILIVAITHGRSKEDWYTWIADRIRNNYGYDTPSNLPRLYAEYRLTRFRANKEMRDKHNSEKYAEQSSPPSRQACSQNDPSAGSASKDELPERKPKAGTVTDPPDTKCHTCPGSQTKPLDQTQNIFIKMALFVLKLLRYLLAMR